MDDVVGVEGMGGDEVNKTQGSVDRKSMSTTKSGEQSGEQGEGGCDGNGEKRDKKDKMGLERSCPCKLEDEKKG